MKMPERSRIFFCTMCASRECLKGHEKEDNPPCAHCAYHGFARDLDYTEEQIKQYGRDLLEEAANLSERLWPDEKRSGHEWTDGFADGTCGAADAIRKLKETL